MQKIAPHTVPLAQQQQSDPAAPSPAMQLAQRIRREQGLEHARRYLEAMEPFIALGERERIAEHIGVPLAVKRAEPHTNSAPVKNNGQNFNNAPNNPMGGGMGGGPMGGMGNMGANPMQLMQMMSQMGGSGGGGMNSMSGMNPMMLAQLFGNMMGGR